MEVVGRQTLEGRPGRLRAPDLREHLGEERFNRGPAIGAFGRRGGRKEHRGRAVEALTETLPVEVLEGRKELK